MSDFSKDTEQRMTSDTGGEKGQKRARFDLIPVDAIWQVAEMYGKGAEKYDERNWERGYDWSLSFAALQRHAHQFWSGEDLDEETQMNHMASVAWHALALLHFHANPDQYGRFDNRPSNR